MCWARYGKIRSIDIKTPLRPPAFAFVAFEDPRDADDAVDGRQVKTVVLKNKSGNANNK